MGVLAEAFIGQRVVERPQQKPRRRPLLSAVGRAAARAVGAWQRARTNVLVVTAFGFLSAAAWSWHLTAGLAAVGASLLVLELLSGSD